MMDGKQKHQKWKEGVNEGIWFGAGLGVSSWKANFKSFGGKPK